MYKSKIRISTENKRALINKLNIFLKTNKYTYCKSLKRKINLDKLPNIILNRKDSSTSRLRTFFVVVDVLKNEKNFSQRIDR